MRSLPFLITGMLLVQLTFGQTFQPTFRESKRTTHKISKKQDYTFGYLEVLEDRSQPNGKTIQLPVYIFKSRSESPAPDPIIYTVGGPGSSTMRSAQYAAYYQYLDDRDFIFFEQRGTAYAEPHLDCPEWSVAVRETNQPGFDVHKADSVLVAAAQACKTRLEAAGINLNGYRTTESAADIADLKTALGIDQYNLLTISYSTKIAQVLLRDHPEGIRSVVMDSPLPLEVSYDEESTDNLMAALEALLEGCENDANCNGSYPDLKPRFLQYLRDKSSNPLQVEVEHPETGAIETFQLRGQDLVTIFTYAYTGDVPNIPLEINKLLNGDLSTIKAELQSLFGEPGSGAGVGMRLSVWCAEEYPFVDQKAVAAATERHPEIRGLSPTVFSAEVCETWGVKPAAPLENEAIQSEVPVLVMGGEYDNETPPAWARQLHQNLPNSQLLIFPAWRHNVTTNWSNPCAMEAANAFFNAPKQLPKLDCLEEIGPPVFKVE